MHATLVTLSSLGALLVGVPTAAMDSVGYHPAAREHVRMVDGVAWRYASRLTAVVELNFTYGNTHETGKQEISRSLARIADRYGVEGKPAFRILKIQSSRGGITSAPDFTLAELLQGEVLVANNTGYLGLGGLGHPCQEALKAAIDSAGRGYLAFHGSAESYPGSSGEWSWFHETLEPRNFQGHSNRILVPVYAHLAEAKHLVLQDVLASNTVLSTLPNETAADGSVLFARNVPARSMMYKCLFFGRDITRDSAYKDKVTLLLKHDDRNLGGSLPRQYQRPGGGVHSYLYRVGKGMTAYIPAGHESDEVMKPATGFDGGVGDFDRYVAQLLFFLAGYDRTRCDKACEGLPLVDAKDHIQVNPLPAARAQPPRSSPATPTKRVRNHAGTLIWVPGTSARPWDSMGRRVPRVRYLQTQEVP